MKLNSRIPLLNRPAANMPSVSDVVTISAAEYQRLLEISCHFTKLKESLLSGGLSSETLDLILYGAPQPSSDTQQHSDKPIKKQVPMNGLSIPPVKHSYPHDHSISAELEDDEGGLTDSRSDERDDYGDSSRSTSTSPQAELRTVLIRGLPDKTTHRDLIEAVRGGAILHTYLWTRDHTASISFVEESAAQDFLDHAKTHGFYIAEKRVEVLWNDRQFYLPPFVRSKINTGASRNLIIHHVNPNITEGLIRRDLDHIHNLIVISVKFKHGNAYISTNSVHNALFARSCMMSRFTYKGMKINFYPDDCAEPLVSVSSGPKKEPQASKRPAPLPNRFHLLSMDGSDDDETDEHGTRGTSIDGGVRWADNSVLV
ncbi:hypothetical protein BJY04DRAFT_223765 [Aspergillus karnatakaensis]|uniref:RNA-binding protein n=1 Tax=Aspergillus karnatakaensis TaxID=1810916 RepID=UPI003CCCB0D8